jgi:serine/threonine protein kinase/DNA-binding SARP family transcriptional activator/WD40 repeat protein
MTLDFGVLGPIEVRRDGQPVMLGGPQQRRIVATLLAERGQVVPIDRLVDAVWPDVPPDGARRTVMTYVSRLRLALGDGHVLTQGPGYRLEADDDAIDAVRFERLVDRAGTVPPTQAITLSDTALALWRGPAYGEFADEWWALPHATRLEELRIVAAEQRAEALISVGACDRAVADLEGLVVTHPLRERSVAQLMRAYEASGRQADALRAYARYREHLAEETGLDPSHALRDLESSIITGTGGGAGPVRATRGYTLGDVIGEGAFATVYRGTQPGVGREVAIKVIRAELADDPVFVRRFEAEAQLVAHLEHPHIVPLYDFWREPGGAYLVFRLLRGGSAHDLLRRHGPWELARADRLIMEIGGALVTAHAAGVVHRDVKPDNVLFDEAGNTYLADFGIAVSDLEPAPDSGSSALPSAGSPLYAAPEQFQRSAPSALGDQYSFATMIWELLTGTPPFDGTTPSTVLQSKLERPLESLRHHRADLPRELDHVLQRATASRAEERYDDMSGMLEAWRSAVQAGVGTTDELDTVPRSSGSRRGVTATAAQLSEDVANPYKGLRAFGEADARDLRGRDRLVASLLDEVREYAFVTVVGASGSGKSSLVCAGLVPRLRAAGMRVVSMVPAEDPTSQLRVALRAAAVKEPSRGGVAPMVRSVTAQAGGPLVIVIDQFEELWTLAPDGERDRFAEGLASVVDGTDEGVRVVVTLRADFFDRPLAHAMLGPLVAAHPFAVTPMSAPELHDAVVAPAARLGVVFEPGLDSTIVSEVANQPASLPLLQFTLAELFERRQGRVIPGAAYESMGGIAGAIASRAEDLYASLDVAGQDAARRLLLRLVIPGDGTEDTRRRVRYSDLPSGTPVVAEALETHRLLVADRDPSTREPTVEIAHETLMRSWPRLRAWLDEDRDLIRRLQHIGTAAHAWAGAGRPDSELYRGTRLDAATDALQARSDQFTDLERNFVDASRAAARAMQERDRRARRRLRRALVATSVALIVALVAGSIALVQRGNATRQAGAADVARLVALSQSLTSTRRDVALLLALEAARRDPGALTTGALQAALSTDLSFLRYLHTGHDSAGQITFSADGRDLYANPQDFGKPPVHVDLATGRAVPIPVRDLDSETLVACFAPVDSTSAVLTRRSRSGQVLPIERIDLADGHVLGTTSIPEEAGHVVVSPDRTRAAVTTVGRTGVKSRVVVLDLATMDVIASVDQPGPAYADQGDWFSQSAWVDDHRLVLGSPSGRLLVWEPGTRQGVRPLNDPPAPGTEFAFVILPTPDGSQVVAGGAAMMAYDVNTGARSWPRARNVGAAIAIDPLAHVVWAQEAGFGSSRMFAYDLATGERTQAELDGQHGTVCDAQVSPDTMTIAMSSCNEGTVALWALDGATSTGAPLEGAGWASSEDMWSPDGRHVAMFRLEAPNAVEVSDLRDGTRRLAEGVEASAVNSPIFRPDGVLQTVNGSNHVIEYDPGTHRAHDTGIVLPGGHVTANIALREPDLSVYGLDDGTVVVIDTAKAQLVRTIKTDLIAVFGLGWSPEGRVYAAGQKERVEVLDVETGEKIATLPTPAANLVVSPDGDLMAAGAFNGTITFYDTTTLTPVGDTLTGGAAFPAQLQFTPDGRTLITSGLDNTLRLFDVASRRQLGVPIAISSWGAAISPDSKEIAITTERGVERLALDAVALSRAACHVAGRNLTAAEWAQYVGGEPRRLCSY